MRRRLATALLALGVLTLLGGATTLLYAPWREAEHLAQQPDGPQEELPAQWDETTADGADRGLRLVAAKTLGESAEWMRIPRIGVNSPVMEMGLQGGEYQVPSFDVGHHVDSANPGQPGNSVYNGHLETINAGHIFARLHELRPGDVVYVYTAGYRFDWVVDETYLVRNDDRSFLRPTLEPSLTLYTCAGTFDFQSPDYTQRQVAVGRLVQVAPRGPSASDRS
jgi:LPXTG-site transpeptidase (sortase) family protein